MNQQLQQPQPQQQQQPIPNLWWSQPIEPSSSITDEIILKQLTDLLNGLMNSNDYIGKAKDWFLRYQHKSKLIVENLSSHSIYLEPPEKKVYLLFLINDILHFSFNQQQKEKIRSVIELWFERQIYTLDQISNLKTSLKHLPPNGISPGAIVTHVRSMNGTPNIPLKSDDINYYDLHQLAFRDKSNNYQLFDSINHFYNIINNNNNNNNLQQQQ
eukprot:gene9267-11359_t